MKCEKCNTENSKSANFCKNCGNKMVGSILIEEEDEPKNLSSDEIKCNNCDYIGPGKRGRRTISQILAILSIFIFWPVTLLYYMATSRYLCLKCGSDNLGVKNKKGVYVSQNKLNSNPMVLILIGLVSMAIIGILSGIIITALSSAREKAQEASLKANSSTESIYEAIKEAEEYANSLYNLPAMIDEETRLDRIYASRDNKMNYDYTLVNYTADELEWSVLEDNILPSMKKSFCQDSFFEYYRDNNIPMRWNYYGIDENLIGSIELLDNDCL